MNENLLENPLERLKILKEKCETCAFRRMVDQEQYVKGKLGTYLIPAAFCLKRRLHLDVVSGMLWNHDEHRWEHPEICRKYTPGEGGQKASKWDRI